jgi:putative oxidoreductase
MADDLSLWWTRRAPTTVCDKLLCNLQIQEVIMNKDLALLVMRVLLVAIFPISAYYKIRGWPGIVTPVTAAGLPLPYYLSILGTTVELVLPFLVILGLGTRWAAAGLIVYTAMTSYIGHPIWRLPPPEFFPNLMSFMKNLAMMGALLLLTIVGPGRLALQPSKDA